MHRADSNLQAWRLYWHCFARRTALEDILRISRWGPRMPEKVAPWISHWWLGFVSVALLMPYQGQIFRRNMCFPEEGLLSLTWGWETEKNSASYRACPAFMYVKRELQYQCRIFTSMNTVDHSCFSDDAFYSMGISLAANGTDSFTTVRHPSQQPHIVHIVMFNQMATLFRSRSLACGLEWKQVLYCMRWLAELGFPPVLQLSFTLHWFHQRSLLTWLVWSSISIWYTLRVMTTLGRTTAHQSS